MTIIGYPPIEHCSVCGGKCCKHFAGIVHPDDVPDGVNGIRALLKNPLYTVDWYEQFECEGMDEPCRGFFVRPCHRGCEGLFYDPSWGGVCVFHSSNGCSLSFKDRPRGCRLLEPLEHDLCVCHGMEKYEGALAWLGYHWLILEEEGVKNDLES